MSKLLLAFLILGLSMPSFSQEDNEDDLPLGMNLMPADEGREDTYYSCTSCHSIRIVLQQGLTKKDWEDTLEWMADEQEMDPLDPETQKIVIAYLAKHYGTDRPNFPTNK